ncbi:FMN-dependent oxidoreductase, nitrilotriacetate monooxygenase family [Actinomadura madurae]|uniref:FMN-dependent oxidoreductase, nitrilotriacetate monooxygenase family n=1 Tax=Actinomadura madurae TaxID=1993 RepID=A0A1I5PP98_9ACTN|nr:FMN-dependent oxidoreductase, nitrilotriacetate monooxygenase family [Actinomadura madurae]
MHTLNHKGKHFSVQGPLNIARMPQGYPVLFLAGQSEAGRELAAKQADCVFSVSNTLPEAQEFYADIKGRLDRYGRAPDSLKVMPGCAVYVGRSEAEADDLYRELQELITPDVGVAYLSKLVDMDLSAYDCDGPMPDLSVETNAIAAFRVQIGAIVQRENLTIRQAYERVLPSMGHTIFKGTALQVADEMEEWYRGKGADGFLINAPIMPSGLHDFVDLVVPELQRRGLFRTAYEGGTLRDRLGLPTPRNPFFD